jgi:hypothetical protein
MKTELRLTVAAIAAMLPLLSANATQTINLGTQPGLPSIPGTGGVVPNGYAGFNWYGAENDELADATSTFFDSAYVTQFGRTAAFDLDSMVVTSLNSDVPSGGDTTNYSTVISGYYNGTLVKTVTESYGWGGAVLSGINLNGVNDVQFATTEISTIYGEPGTFRSGDFTLVQQLTVGNYTGVAKAPEMDPTMAASALTLLAGSLLVLRGRRSKSQASA